MVCCYFPCSTFNIPHIIFICASAFFGSLSTGMPGIAGKNVNRHIQWLIAYEFIIVFVAVVCVFCITPRVSCVPLIDPGKIRVPLGGLARIRLGNAASLHVTAKGCLGRCNRRVRVLCMRQCCRTRLICVASTRKHRSHLIERRFNLRFALFPRFWVHAIVKVVPALHFIARLFATRRK